MADVARVGVDGGRAVGDDALVGVDEGGVGEALAESEDVLGGGGVEKRLVEHAGAGEVGDLGALDGNDPVHAGELASEELHRVVVAAGSEDDFDAGGLEARDRRVMDWAWQRRVPLAFTMAGGYGHDMETTVQVQMHTYRTALAYHQRWQAPPPAQATVRRAAHWHNAAP